MSDLIIDTSAVLAMVLDEPKSERIRLLIRDTPTAHMSAGTLLELRIVVLRKFDRERSERVSELVSRFGIIIVPVTEKHAILAAEAYASFGKGQSHPAQLNFGDCFSYALAKQRGSPLLFVGDDFSRTDLTPALS